MIFNLNLKFLFFSFIIWMMFLFCVLFVGNTLLPYRNGQEFTNILNITSSGSVLHSTLLYPFANFDGVHYLTIANVGYTTEAGFFPLYPLVIKLFGFDGSIENYFFSGLVFSNIAFIIGLIFLYKLIKLDFSDNVAKQSIIYLLIFPTSFYFACIYSESLFFLLSILTFYFARKRKWLYVGIFGMLLSATRIVGILILPVLFWEFYILEKNTRQVNIKRILPLILLPVGLLSYMLFNFLHWGNLLYFVKAQGLFGNSRSVDQIILFPQTIFRYFKIITTVSFQQYELWVASLELGITVFALFMLFVSLRKKIRMSYIIFSILALLLPISSGTLSGMPRYILVIFPIYIALASIENKFLKTIYSIVSVFLLIILWTLFSKGYYVA